MEGVVITKAMEEYAKECLEAEKNSPRPALTAEQMREQVQRLHEEVLRRRRNAEDFLSINPACEAVQINNGSTSDISVSLEK